MTRAKILLWLLLAAAAIAVLVGLYLWLWGESEQPQPAPPAQTEPRAEAPALPPAPASAPIAPVEPEVLHPIEAAQQQLAGEATVEPGKEVSGASLDESDNAVEQALAGLYGGQATQYFYLNNLVRRIVATVDNLPRKQVSIRLVPLKPPGGLFLTRGEGGSVYLSPENYGRYGPYVRLLESAGPKQVVAVYVRLYPLFQQAYEELGYPNKYFNDRLVEVIDHLLAAPDIEGPIELIQPRVLYQFADPNLEALSAGQKALIRMGRDNASRVKAHLREFRQALTGQLPAE